MSSRDRTVGAARDFAQELPLGHLRGAVGQIARDVLEQDLPPEEILYFAHARDDAGERLLGVGQRQEIVHIASLDARPAQMIGDPGGLDAPRQLAHAGEILPVEGIGAADGQRHAVHDHRKAAANALEIMQRLAAGDEVILGDDLQPIDGVRLLEHGLVVRGPQAQTETVDLHDQDDRGRARA